MARYCMIGRLFYLKKSNTQEGINLLKQASKSNFDQAQYLLARLYHQGVLVNQDIRKAASYYELLVTHNYKDSRQQLSLIIESLSQDIRHIAADSTADQALLAQLNSTLDIEVITVNSHSTNSVNAMTNLLARFKKNRRFYDASTGSRIKGRNCSETAYSCSGLSEEDIEDARNESVRNN